MKHKRKDKSEADDLHEAEQAGKEEQRGESQMKPDTIESLRAEKDELFAKLQRVSADYANYQKRVPKQITDSIAYEKERVIKTLLPALDNFEHTLQNAHSAENVDVLLKGIRIIYDQMLDILKYHNVEQIEALGEKFDPALHQAMTRQSNPDKAEDTVLEEFQKGYKLNGRVIRPSMVIVNKFQEQQPGDDVKDQLAENQDDESERNDSEQ
jgi:molecular chaperone GrpE